MKIKYLIPSYISLLLLFSCFNGNSILLKKTTPTPVAMPTEITSLEMAYLVTTGDTSADESNATTDISTLPADESATNVDESDSAVDESAVPVDESAASADESVAATNMIIDDTSTDPISYSYNHLTAISSDLPPRFVPS